MIVLGIEGTAHTLGIGIVDSDYSVLCDIRRVYVPKAGIHPRESSQFMSENMAPAIASALDQAGLGLSDIGLISFSQGPGMGPCLRTVATAARTLSLHYNIPLLGVNHCIAHIEIGKVLCRMHDPLVVYVSGGNTQVLKLKDGRYRVFGETLDIGAGNMLDKFGRQAGLGHPAGPKIEKLALEAETYLELPYVVKGTDMSFSGLLTSAIQKISKNQIADVCFSLQETLFSMICEVSERALAHLNAGNVLLTGGVANNQRLCDMMKAMSAEHNVCFGVPGGFCSDNGVMIALLGLLMHSAGVSQEVADTSVLQRFRPDTVNIGWALDF